VGIEQRKSARLDVNFQIAVRLANFRHADKAATLTNISKGGVCFLSNLELQQGDRVEIDLPATQVITLKFKVIWCREQRDRYSTGAEYVDTSEARRARVLEMHQAIADYQKMNSETSDLQRVAVEWLDRFSAKFLSVAP